MRGLGGGRVRGISTPMAAALLIMVAVVAVLAAAAALSAWLAPQLKENPRMKVSADAVKHSAGAVISYRIVNVGDVPLTLIELKIGSCRIPLSGTLTPTEAHRGSSYCPGIAEGEYAVIVVARTPEGVEVSDTCKLYVG